MKMNECKTIDEQLFIQHGFYLVETNIHDENPVYKYARTKDYSIITFDSKSEQVYISCDYIDQDLLLLIMTKTFELGWGAHSKLINLKESILQKYIGRINNECNTELNEIYSNPLIWIKSLDISNNQIEFYNDIFTIDTSIKNIIDITLKIQYDGYDVSDFRMIECYRLKDEDNYDDVGKLYLIFKNKLSNEEFLILYDVNTRNMCFGYRTKDGENFSQLYSIKICIDNFNPDYCYLYR